LNNTKAHQELLDKIMLAVGSLPNVRIWPRGVGLAKNMYNENVIRYGIPGESDLDGIIAPHGRRLHIEIKTGSGKLSEKQQKFKAMIEKFGGVYIEARSVEDCLTELKKYL